MEGKDALERLKSDPRFIRLMDKSNPADESEKAPGKLPMPEATKDMVKHFFTMKGEAPSQPIDSAIYKYIVDNKDIVIIGRTPWIYEHGVFRIDATGSKLQTMVFDIIEHFGADTLVKAPNIRRIYDLFTLREELRCEFDDMNRYPEHWICFENGMYDPIKGELHPHNAKYRSTNIVPHHYNPDADPTGEEFDTWFERVVPDASDREMVLQYIGLCMTRDTRQQKFLMLVGDGGTGKSTLISLVEAMIGSDNASHVALQLLNERFATFGLVGKLLNSCADLRVTALEDVSVLKQILGEDSIRAEQKGKDAISFKSYAKLLFSVNGMPVVRDERTNGFFRRLLICTMNVKPSGDPDPTLPERLRETCMDHLIHLAVDALARMYEKKTIVNSKQSQVAIKQLMRDSDSIEAWLDEGYDRVGQIAPPREISGAFPESKMPCKMPYEGKIAPSIDRAVLYTDYSDYCEKEGRQALGKMSFYRALRAKGIQERKTNGIWHFVGISQKGKEVPIEEVLFDD